MAQETVEEYLQKNTHGIGQVNQKWSLKILDTLGNNANVYLIGESNPRQKTNPDIKLRFLKYLHKKQNVRFLMLEYGMAEAWLFNVESPGDAVRVTYDRFDPPYRIVETVKTALSEKTKVRSVVVLLRPSIAGVGSEILGAFRLGRYQVALEILDEETRVAPPSVRAQP